jgi:tetratricopeptide (TPR) repeat protein
MRRRKSYLAAHERLPGLLAVFTCLLTSLLSSGLAHARTIELAPQARQALEAIYGGDTDTGIEVARILEQRQPENPLGFLLEAEGQWWKIYCSGCEIKWGMIDAWKRPKQPEDAVYLRLASKAVDLARAQLAKSDTAEMHLDAGIGWALEARLYGLRDERHNTARAGVAARSEFLKALQLDPDMADATAGLGFYNYYIDTLSTVVKVLRFFMGIPGGNKNEGIRQMRTGIERGVLLRIDAQFYLAKNFHTYDQRYADALMLAEPLADRYPNNPIFQLLAGNLEAETGQREKAGKYFRAALASPGIDPNSPCAARVRDLANSFLFTLR